MTVVGTSEITITWFLSDGCSKNLSPTGDTMGNLPGIFAAVRVAAELEDALDADKRKRYLLHVTISNLMYISLQY
jgi:hypothetical protein